MPTVEERLAYIEGRVEEHTHAMGEFRSAVVRLDHRMGTLAGRIDGLSDRVDGLDLKVDRVREELAGRFDGLDQKLSRIFLWVVSVQLTVLLAIVGTLLQLAR